MEYEERAIEEARQRKAAAQALLDVLIEGTAQQKVTAADNPFLRQHPPLTQEQQEQLDLARALVETLLVNDNERIVDAYHAIEFSPLRKYFIFTDEEQRRIQEARDKRAALQQFRQLLTNGGVTVVQLANARNSLPGLAHYLSEDEQYVVDLAVRFLQLYREMQQDQQGKNAQLQAEFVRIYNALCYAPYQVAFIAQEENRVKRCQPVETPALLVFKDISVTMSQLIALRKVKRQYADLQIANAQKRLAGRFSDADRQYYTKVSDYWKKQLDSGCSHEAILSDLVSQRLLEEELQRTPKRGDVKLDNKVRDASNDISKELSRSFGDEPDRDAVRFLALSEVFSRNPPDSRALTDWLGEQWGTQEILYFERPEPGAQITRERSRCWLFRWWRLRSAQNSVDGGRA